MKPLIRTRPLDLQSQGKNTPPRLTVGRDAISPPTGRGWGRVNPPAAKGRLLPVGFLAVAAVNLACLVESVQAAALQNDPTPSASAPSVAPPLNPVRATVYFSPHGGCTAAIVQAIGAARHSVQVLAYGFTSRPIAQALLAAKARGVSVTVVLDKSNRHARSSQAAYLHLNGIEPLLDHNHAIAHNKVMTIDEQEVITGSFNFTVEAENDNAENLLILQDCAALAAAYAANIAVHVAHARTYGSES